MSRALLPTSLSLLALAAPLAGCDLDLRDEGPWTDATDYRAVWSDDGSEILVARHDYQERSVNAGHSDATTDFRGDVYELAITTRETPDVRRVIASDIRGMSSFYFMKSAGYVLVDTWSDDETAAERDGFIDLADGHFRPLDAAALGWSTGDFSRHDLLPSPDGELVAMVETEIGATDAQVQMIGADGEAASERAALSGAGDWFIDTQWNADGQLDVFTEFEDPFRVSTDGRVELARATWRPCGPTTSSEVDAENQEVYADVDGTLSFDQATVRRTWACL